MSCLLLRALLMTCILHVSIATIQLLSSDGRFVSHKQLTRVLPTTTSDELVTILDCSVDSKVSFVNSLLGTSFNDGNGLLMESKSGRNILYSSIISLLPLQINTLIEYYFSLSRKLILLMDANQIGSCLEGSDRIIRQLVQSAHLRAMKKDQTEVTIVCIGNKYDSEEVKTEVSARFRELWLNIHPPNTFENEINLKIETVNESEPFEIKSYFQPSTVVTDSSGSTLSQLLVDKWKSLSQFPTVSHAPEYQQSIGEIEIAYMKNLLIANAALNQWQTRVASGKPVINFGERVKTLLTDIQKDFQLSSHIGFAVKERSDRLKTLVLHVVSVVSQLQKQQLNNMALETENRFKQGMLKLVISKPESRKSEEEKLMRGLLFEFKTNCDAMDSDWVSGTGQSFQVKLEDDLQAILKEFPESNTYKLLSQQLEMKTAQASIVKRKSNKRRFPVISGFGVSLVGMLRPPGHGNFQGIVGYSLKQVGWPVDLLLGIQNDGESMEIMGEDREFPLLRLQPKLNFNIDL